MCYMLRAPQGGPFFYASIRWKKNKKGVIIEKMIID